MDSSEALSILRLVSAICILGFASVLDWRTRRVPNKYWIALTVLGIALLPVQLAADEIDMAYLLILVPILAIFSDVYLDTDYGTGIAKYAPIMKYAVAFASMAVMGSYWGRDSYFQHLLAIPAMMLFIVVLYMADVIKGGADAKALMSLAVLFPFYPAIGPFPALEATTPSAEVLFPFAFVVLVNAAIVVALFPIGFLALNLKRREFVFPQGLLGYMLPIAHVQGRHVWPMEKVENGVPRISSFPAKSDDLDADIEQLKALGRTKVWVTPKVPFIIPISVSIVFSTVVGNLLLLLFPV